MRKVKLYIAMSLDGFIANDKGSVDFIEGDGSDENNFGTYNEFYESIDTVIIGKNTYDQIVNELSPDEWPYEGKMSYIITSGEIKESENIKKSSNLIECINTLKKSSGKDIWICGGASIVNQLINENLIDEYRVTIIPTILSKGTKLFDIKEQLKLKLISYTSYNGFVEVKYEKRGINE